MSDFHVSVIPVGKVEPGELEAALSRVAKSVRQPLELRASLPLPQGVEESGRGQFRASLLMQRLLTMVPQLRPGRLIGGEEAGDARPPLKSDAFVFVTDADLYTASSDSVFAALMSAQRTAVVSVRRLREAFYRRKADPTKQRARLVKELVRMVGRLRGAPECASPQCVLSASKMFADLDLKEERLCRSCAHRLFEGTIRI